MHQSTNNDERTNSVNSVHCVIQIREKANGHGAWDRTYEVMMPDSSVVVCDSYQAALNVAAKIDGSGDKDEKINILLNAYIRATRSFEIGVQHQLDKGKTVVAEFCGSQFIGYETFSGDDANIQALKKVNDLASRLDGSFGQVYFPGQKIFP
jgi:hypothetical protein